MKQRIREVHSVLLDRATKNAQPSPLDAVPDDRRTTCEMGVDESAARLADAGFGTA
jgi:hypothetical protein